MPTSSDQPELTAQEQADQDRTEQQERAQKHRKETIQGLRDFAQFIENGGPVPDMVISWKDFWKIDDESEKKRFLRDVPKMGEFKREESDHSLCLKKSFGPVRFKLEARRELVCVRRQVGTTKIPAQPAQPAQPERETPIFEYDCPPSLLELARETTKAEGDE